MRYQLLKEENKGKRFFENNISKRLLCLTNFLKPKDISLTMNTV